MSDLITYRHESSSLIPVLIESIYSLSSVLYKIYIDILRNISLFATYIISHNIYMSVLCSHLQILHIFHMYLPKANLIQSQFGVICINIQSIILVTRQIRFTKDC